MAESKSAGQAHPQRLRDWQTLLKENLDPKQVEKAKRMQEQDLSSLHSALMKRDLPRTRGAALDLVQSGGRYLGYLAGTSGEPVETTALHRLFAYGMWGWALDQEEMLASPQIPRYGPNGHERNLAWLFCLALTSRADQSLTRWIGRLLLNTYLAGTIDNLPGDREFNDWMWALVRAFDRNEWPSQQDLPEGLGVYRALFNTVSDAAAFRDALSQVCETAVSRALGREGKDQQHFIYEYDPWGLFPLDLLAFQAVRKATTGDRVAMDADHPWLRSAFSRIPEFRSEYEDSTTVELASAGRMWFGEQWRPWVDLPVYVAER